MQYGAQRGVPWGISESAYNAQDLERNYQYRAFGVPGLGLKRGLADDLVVAPVREPAGGAARAAATCCATSSGCAARAWPAATASTRRSTTRRSGMPEGATGGVVLPTYMAHHQGMSLVALDNALHDCADAAPLPRRSARAGRRPAAAGAHPAPGAAEEPADRDRRARPVGARAPAPSVRRYATPHTLSPRAHLLSNGSYVVMVTNAGGGYSRRQQTGADALARGRHERRLGQLLLRARPRHRRRLVDDATSRPPREPDEYEVTFAPDRAVFRRAGRRHRDPHRGRRLARRRCGAAPRVGDQSRRRAAQPRPDQLRGGRARARPTPTWRTRRSATCSSRRRSVPERDALICVRRPRSGERAPATWCTSSAAAAACGVADAVRDRPRPVHRPRRHARAAARARPASAAVEHDRRRCSIRSSACGSRSASRPARPRGSRSRPAYAESEEAARQPDREVPRPPRRRPRAGAGQHAQPDRAAPPRPDRRGHDRVPAARRAACSTGDPRLRDVEAIEAQPRGPARAVEVRHLRATCRSCSCASPTSTALPLVAELLKAHEYLRLKGLLVRSRHPQRACRPATCRICSEALQRLVESGPEQGWIDKPGGVFLRRADLMPPEDQLLLRAAARVVMDAADGGLRNQLDAPAGAVRAGTDAIAKSPIAARRSRSPARSVAAGRRPRPRAVQRARRVRRRRARVRHAGRAATGAVPPAPWTQRRRPRDASGSPAPSRGPATRGRRTATTTGSRRGATIRSAIRPAKPCSSATRTAARSGRRRRCPPGGGAAVHGPARAGLLASTNTRATSSPRS